MAYKSTVYYNTSLHHPSDDSSLPAPLQAHMALSQAPGAMALGRGRGQLLVQFQVVQVVTVDLDEEI